MKTIPFAGELRVCRVSGGFFRVDCVNLRAGGGVQETVHRHQAGPGRLLEARAEEHIGGRVVCEADGLRQVGGVEGVQGVQIVQPVDDPPCSSSASRALMTTSLCLSESRWACPHQADSRTVLHLGYWFARALVHRDRRCQSLSAKVGRLLRWRCRHEL